MSVSWGPCWCSAGQLFSRQAKDKTFNPFSSVPFFLSFPDHPISSPLILIFGHHETAEARQPSQQRAGSSRQHIKHFHQYLCINIVHHIESVIHNHCSRILSLLHLLHLFFLQDQLDQVQRSAQPSQTQQGQPQ